MILVWTAPRTTRRSTSSCCTSTAGCVRSRTCRSATGCTCWAARPRGTNWSVWCWPSCGRTRCSPARSAACRPVCGPGARALGLTDGASMHEVDRGRGQARALVEAVAEAGWDAAAVPAIVAFGPRRSDNRRARPALAGVRLPGGGAAAAGDHRRDHAPPCTPWTAASCRPVRRVRRSAAWSTCCPPAATSTPSTPRPSRRGWPTRPARPWPSRCCSGIATRPGSIRRRSASRCGAPRPCGPAATTSARCWPCSA